MSDLEIDPAANKLTRMICNVQRARTRIAGEIEKGAAIRKSVGPFFEKTRRDSATVPANFPLGYAEELAANKIRVRATDGFFWPEREAKSDKEIEMMGRALRITEAGLKRAIEVLKASKPGSAKRAALEC